ncbi:IS30-like element ISApl1 family transposase [Glaesserella parasuis]|nr:IS30-like element ISApl1 family transposase [Glaesserella parasuis]QQF73337.1 IS30-like element ISApl1 family transposase [Histophilus somni]USQ17663.1 IS30-like element ISApl1 family transposase [Actinobacillus pleuropneumoniae]HDX1004366.1 IS30-like element ISApl1 family transposase [Pasteurella multocida]QKJ70975.1 IS30-like element ISApl1 family transposase [Glaesserella parasuis]
MSTSYRHLTINEREKIMILLAQGKKQAEIAKALGRSSSTISRELKRHALESYSATNAQNSYLKHRQNSKAQRKLEQPEYFNLVQEKFLTENWSPEQISARLKLEKSELSISYSTIYRGIYSGLFDIGERKASRKLRHKGKTRHTKNHHEKRGKIQISNHLNDRPISAQNRSRFGHWEADTVLGKAGGACLLTLTERKSRFELVKKIPAKKAEAVQKAMIELLDSHILRSITPDRGKEFAQHRLVTEALGVEFYFPEPHQPWTRGTNENTNGLLREYFPKHQDINQWSEVDIQQVINKLNLRPRKCLGWKTPYEVYFKKTLHLV